MQYTTLDTATRNINADFKAGDDAAKSVLSTLDKVLSFFVYKFQYTPDYSMYCSPDVFNKNRLVGYMKSSAGYILEIRDYFAFHAMLDGSFILNDFVNNLDVTDSDGMSEALKDLSLLKEVFVREYGVVSEQPKESCAKGKCSMSKKIESLRKV